MVTLYKAVLALYLNIGKLKAIPIDTYLVLLFIAC